MSEDVGGESEQSVSRALWGWFGGSVGRCVRSNLAAGAGRLRGLHII
jgi:hypothetical protein